MRVGSLEVGSQKKLPSKQRQKSVKRKAFDTLKGRKSEAPKDKGGDQSRSGNGGCGTRSYFTKVERTKWKFDT